MEKHALLIATSSMGSVGRKCKKQTSFLSGLMFQGHWVGNEWTEYLKKQNQTSFSLFTL